MLYSVNDLSSYVIAATDGNIGHVRGFYFDPKSWTIYYLVVDTGEWLPGRKVLISLIALGKLDANKKSLPISLSKGQIRNSPAIDEGAPIPSLHELNAYYGWQFSLGGDMPSWGIDLIQDVYMAGEDVELRSTHEVSGFDVRARNGDVGTMEDFVIDDEAWTVRYLVIDTGNRLPGEKLLISRDWANKIGWHEKKVHVAAAREAIESAPACDRASLPDIEYAQRLFA
jgi:uncharacterized protein YrrD